MRICQRNFVVITAIFFFFSCTLQAAEFSVTITGVADEVLSAQLLEVAESQLSGDEAPATESRLYQMARQHLPALQKLMRSEGYYRAQITPKQVTVGAKPHINYQVTPGARIAFGKVEIKLEDIEHGYAIPSLSELALIPGEPAKAQVVIDSASKLKKLARDAGYPHAQVSKTDAVIDHQLEVMNVEFALESGPVGKLALPTFSGSTTVKTSALLAKVPWQAGDLYHPDLESQFKQRLLDARLFAVVRIGYGKKLTEDGLLPVQVELKERKHRILKAGVQFHSDEGIGADLSWQHRNYFGAGEWFEVDLDLAVDAQVFETTFRKPEFYRLDQALRASFSLENRTTDAFEGLILDTGIGIERNLSANRDVTLGVGFRLSDIEQDGEKNSYGLIYLPIDFKWDTSDNLLHPTQGFRMQLEAAPYVDMLNDSSYFLRLYGRFSHYIQVMDSPRVILAGRLTLASMLGASRERIPPDLRFYAGGGGSVRGIGYQLASPLDDDNDPLGGRSLFELRKKL